MKQIVNGLLYNTETATLVASDRYWDGSNYDRRGRNQYLYKTVKGNYFLYITTMWAGERNSIVPVTKDEAMGYYEILPETEMEYEEAFDVQPEEA